MHSSGSVELTSGYEQDKDVMGNRQKEEKLSETEKRLAKQYHLGTNGNPFGPLIF